MVKAMFPGTFYPIHFGHIDIARRAAKLFDEVYIAVYDKPVLAGELYGPLLDLKLFNQVAVDSEIRTLVWPNGADFDPATLHDWPQHKDAFAARAREWERVSA